MIDIIEDDTDIREMESYALRNSGFDILEVSIRVRTTIEPSHSE